MCSVSSGQSYGILLHWSITVVLGSANKDMRYVVWDVIEE